MEDKKIEIPSFLLTNKSKSNDNKIPIPSYLKKDKTLRIKYPYSEGAILVPSFLFTKNQQPVVGSPVVGCDICELGGEACSSCNTDCTTCQGCYSCVTCQTCQTACESACQDCDTCQGCYACVTCQTDCTTCQGCYSCVTCQTDCTTCQGCYSCVTCQSCDVCQGCNSCDTCQGCNTCDYCNTCQSCNTCQDACQLACQTCLLPQAPTTPPSIWVNSKTYYSIDIGWDTPTNATSTSCSSSGGTVTYTGSNSATITGLVSNTNYTITVTASSSAGSTSNSITVRTLPYLYWTYNLVKNDKFYAQEVLDSRRNVDEIRVYEGFSKYSWAETITPKVTLIKATHLNELRSVINGLKTTSFGVDAVRGDKILFQHWQDIRNAINAIL